MNEIISFVVPKDLCEGCIVTKCRKTLKDKTQCYLNRPSSTLVKNKVPETFEEFNERDCFATKEEAQKECEKRNGEI